VAVQAGKTREGAVSVQRLPRGTRGRRQQNDGIGRRSCHVTPLGV
jgi:hypothetical protein